MSFIILPKNTANDAVLVEVKAGTTIVIDDSTPVEVNVQQPVAIDDSTPIEVNVQQPVTVNVDNFEDITDPLPVESNRIAGLLRDILDTNNEMLKEMNTMNAHYAEWDGEDYDGD